MLKKTIKYEDLNGDMVEEDFYFNYSTNELLEMEANTPGGMEALLTRVGKSDDLKEILGLFKKLTLEGLGKKSEDGRYFVKTQEYRDQFADSEAFSALIVSFIVNPGQAAEFVNGMFPIKALEAAKAKQKENSVLLENQGSVQSAPVQPKLAESQKSPLGVPTTNKTAPPARVTSDKPSDDYAEYLAWKATQGK